MDERRRCAHCEEFIDEGIGVVEVRYDRPAQTSLDLGFTQTLHFCSDLCLRPYVVLHTEKLWDELQKIRQDKARLREELGVLKRELDAEIRRIVGGEADADPQ